MSFELEAFREHKSDNDISESAVMDVQRNFNEGSSYEKQLMSILYFAPFTVEFDRRLDIFYSLLDEGLISTRDPRTEGSTNHKPPFLDP